MFVLGFYNDFGRRPQFTYPGHIDIEWNNETIGADLGTLLVKTGLLRVPIPRCKI